MNVGSLFWREVEIMLTRVGDFMENISIWLWDWNPTSWPVKCLLTLLVILGLSLI